MSELSQKQNVRQVPVILEIPVTQPTADVEALFLEFRSVVDELKQEVKELKEAAKLPLSYSEKEAAEILQISELSLARMRRSGKIPYTPVAGKARYTRTHLEDYLDSNTTKPRRSGRKQ